VTAGTRAAQLLLRASAQLLVRLRAAVQVQGLEHLPRRGPVLLASRHYHHLYDGLALLAVSPRPLHFLVGLDWVRSPRLRRVLEQACWTARWPIIVRADSPLLNDGSAYRRTEGIGLARRAVQEVEHLFQAGAVVVIFPEGYPGIDPSYTPKDRPDAFLPFRPGLARLIARSQQHLGIPIPVVPVGLRYRRSGRWEIRVAFGPPLLLSEPYAALPFHRRVEAEVVRLSGGREADGRHESAWGNDGR
jgi:1-acyl-sn-glycerol-3-phosphate acyltransferase